jgi:hypothetical protein
MVPSTGDISLKEAIIATTVRLMSTGPIEDITITGRTIISTAIIIIENIIAVLIVTTQTMMF